MSANVSTLPIRSNIPAKSIALPVEHGAWGFLFEPLLAGVLLAPSFAAPFILLLTAGAFMMRQPMKFLVGDMMKGRKLPRTPVARRFSLYFGAITAVGLAGSLILAPATSLIPFAAVLPLGIYVFQCDLSRQSRQLIPELGASFALASSVTVMAFAAGWATAPALALWAIFTAREIPSVLYVRSRLRLSKGQPAGRTEPIVAHVAGLLIVAWLYWFGLGSILTVIVCVFLLGRAVYGLSSWSPVLRAKTVGVREVVYGIIFALSVVIGYWVGI